jgi:RimJ/RimL family protein N-acetyltransferase
MRESCEREREGGPASAPPLVLNCALASIEGAQCDGEADPACRLITSGPPSSKEITIRAVRRDDGERIAKAFRGLEPLSIYRRFFFPKKDLSDEELRALTESDGRRTVVLVATVGSGAEETIVGLGQYARHGTAAQIAFAVEESFQRQGIAARMLQCLARIGREQGVCRFEADVLVDNAPMLRVLRHCGLPIEQHESDDAIHLTLFLCGRPEQAHASAGAGAT